MKNRAIPNLSETDRAFVRDMVLYQDRTLIALNKPSGLPSQVRGNRARNLDHLLWAFARSNGKRPRLVHRLDSGTSGVILAAQTQPAAAALSEALATRSAEKVYLAVVSGTLPAEQGVIDAPIARLETDRGHRLVVNHPDGKPAQTAWRQLTQSNGLSLLEVRPRTGRMHQIRLHLAELGTPIYGDKTYGGAPASRMMLHAAAISVIHPTTGEPFRAEASPPDTMCALFPAFTGRDSLAPETPPA